jgi:hypothetical protein
MEFEKLISVSGKGSLYKIVSKTNFGLIAESLEDGKRMPVYQSNNVSTLTDISIYTNEGDVLLKEVLLKIYEKEEGKECPAAKVKDPEVKVYFESILPDYDKEKVYISDIKKLIKWYNQLVKSNLLDPEELKKKDEVASSEEGDNNDIKAEESADKKTAPKKEKTDAAKKKAVTAKTNTAAPKVKNAPAKKVQTVRKAGG